MLHPDTEISRQLVREHHAELEQDWGALEPAPRNAGREARPLPALPARVAASPRPTGRSRPVRTRSI